MAVLQEKKGTRKFEKISRWNVLSYTTITRNNANAKYADNADSKNDKLFLTYFRLDNTVFPFRRFEKVAEPVMLSDLTRLVMKDSESNMWLEINATKDKVRMYKEVS